MFPVDNLSDGIFQHSLRLCRLVMCFMGIVPFESYQVINKNGATWRSFIWSLFCTILALTSIILVTVARYSYSNELSYSKTDDLSGTINEIGHFALVIVHLIVQLESTWKAAKFFRIFEHFEHMRMIFAKNLDVEVDLKVIRSYSVWLNVFFIFYALLTVIITVIQSITSTTITLYSELVTKMKIIEFCQIFAVVLVLLQQMVTVGQTFVRDLHATRFDPWPKRKKCLERFFVLQDLHAELWASLRCMEKYFESSLAGLWLKIFLDITLLSYWLYQGFDCNTEDILKVYCIGFMSLQIIMLTVLCTICSFCEILDKRFRILFHNISTDRRNLYLSACLREMCLQLMQEKVEFSAGGFVDMNIKTLGSFLFSAITFIVILIQFRMGDRVTPCRTEDEGYNETMLY